VVAAERRGRVRVRLQDRVEDGQGPVQVRILRQVPCNSTQCNTAGKLALMYIGMLAANDVRA